MSGVRGGWEALQKIGLAAALVGLLVFVAALGAGDYLIDNATLADLATGGAIQEDHREAIVAELTGLEGHRYRTILGLLPPVDAALARADEALGGGIGDYWLGEYRFAIVRQAAVGSPADRPFAWLLASIGLAAAGGLLLFLARIPGTPAGTKNDGVFRSSIKARGVLGIAFGAFLIFFYIALYFFPALVANWIRLADPVSEMLRGRPADRWFFYGFLYTVVVAVMGVRMLVNYRHSRYHLVRTASVIFFQTGFAFLIPAILAALNRPEVDFKNAWPLDYSLFYGYRLDSYTSGGAFGWFVLCWAIGLALLVVPLFAFLFGKRWYCSWVCGCGGLAETLGDPFRQLSDKRLKAWRVERWTVHGVLVLAVGMTAVVLINYLSAKGGSPLFGDITWRLQKWYGFFIASIFAGVVGTGFYPLMGNRVWCRFGCPLAAVLGIVQRFKSRFRITTNGGQCISCGNCSTYCEMGIDVRWYAQRGQNIVRASCVGCGVCAAVCPRGVLRLENGPESGRFAEPGLVQIGSGRIEVA